MASSGGAVLWRADASHTLFFPFVAQQKGIALKKRITPRARCKRHDTTVSGKEQQEGLAKIVERSSVRWRGWTRWGDAAAGAGPHS